MKNIFLILLLVASFLSKAQSPPFQKPITYGYEVQHMLVTQLAGIPNDTVAVPTILRPYAWIARKDGFLYMWSTVNGQWELIVGGGGTGRFAKNNEDTLGTEDRRYNTGGYNFKLWNPTYSRSYFLFSDGGDFDLYRANEFGNAVRRFQMNSSGVYLADLGSAGNPIYSDIQMQNDLINIRTYRDGVGGANFESKDFDDGLGTMTSHIFIDKGAKHYGLEAIFPHGIKIGVANTSTPYDYRGIRLDTLANIFFDSLANNTSQDVLVGMTNAAGSTQGKLGYITTGFGVDIASGVLKADTAEVVTQYALTQEKLDKILSRDPNFANTYWVPAISKNLEFQMGGRTFGANDVSDFYINLTTNEWAIQGGGGGSNTSTIISSDIVNRMHLITGFTTNRKSDIWMQPDSIAIYPGGDGKIFIDSLRTGTSADDIMTWNTGMVRRIASSSFLFKSDSVTGYATQHDLTQIGGLDSVVVLSGVPPAFDTLVYYKDGAHTTITPVARYNLTNLANGDHLKYDSVSGSFVNFKPYDTVALSIFGAGAGDAGDTTSFGTGNIYGSFFHTGSDTLVITNLRIALQGTSPSVTVKIFWNDSLNVEAGATALVTAGSSATNIYTGTSVTSFDNTKIPPGVWVWCKTSAVTTKPTYMTVSLIGYKKRVYP